MSERAPLIQIDHLSKSFSGNKVLKGVSFRIEPGEVLALVGENGAGKSTLINILTGLLPPDSGGFEYAGRHVSRDNGNWHWGPRLAREFGLDAVHQELSLSPNLSVAENLYLGTWPTRFGVIDRKRLMREATSMIEEIGVPIDQRMLVMRLSLGEQQLVELAKALAAQPRLLILDEATSALDDDQVAAVFGTIRKLRQQGSSVIFVSHRMPEVFAISDRIAVLKDGTLVGVLDTATTSHDELIKLMVGRDLEELFPEKKSAIREQTPLLAVRNLTSGRAVHGITFDIPPGTIMGLGGLQGHGQKEVLRSLFGARKHSGAVSLSGTACQINSPRDAMEHGIAYLPEDRKTQGLLLPLSVRFNASLPSVPRLSRELLTISRSREATLVQELVTRLQIKAPSIRLSVDRLSGGNQQKVALSKWLPAKPDVYLLDEPTRGIDIGTKREIYFLLRQLADEGAAILMTSSDTMELVGLCDSVTVMFEGRVAKYLEGEEVTEENVVRASVMGSHQQEEPA